MPVVKNACPVNHQTKREYFKQLLEDIKKDIPFAKERVLGAITSPERYNLFDKTTNFKEACVNIKNKNKEELTKKEQKEKKINSDFSNYCNCFVCGCVDL